MRRAAVIGALLAVQLACRGEPCESGPPSLVLDVVAQGAAAGARSLRVTLTVGERSWERDLDLAGELSDGKTSVGAEIVPHPAAAFEARARVRAYAEAGQQGTLLAEGEQRYSAAANACNRFTLTLTAAAVPDAGGLDGPADPDAASPDAVHPDAQEDAGAPDVPGPEDTGPLDTGEVDGGCVDDDSDGVCNAEDVCPGFDDALDMDRDSVPDDCDNCPWIRNLGQDDTNGIAAFAVPFAFQTVPNAEQHWLGDDEVAVPVGLGFDFVFFGQTYDSISISSNGFVSFDLGAGHGCCHGGFPDPMPPNALISLAWMDLYPPNGAVTSTTVGAAPNRQFIVTFDAVPWCCEMDGPVTAQLVLFEGSNAVEIHTLEQPAGQDYSRGIEDENGVWAAFVDNERWRNYALSMDAVGFTTSIDPDGIGDACSNATDVPF